MAARISDRFWRFGPNAPQKQGATRGADGDRKHVGAELVSSSDELGTTQGRQAAPSERLAHDSGLGVEASLAVAIERASAAGRWDVVAQLAGELHARRASIADVISLEKARHTRRRARS